MCDAAGELADGLHLLRLAQLCFGALLTRDVLDEAEQQWLAITHRAQLRQTDAGPGDRRGTGDIADFHDVARRIVQQLAVIDVGDVGNGEFGDLVGGVAQHATERRVRLDDALVIPICQQDAERTFLKDVAGAEFTLA